MNEAADLDRVFHALSDPTRRAILQRLSREQASVSELARPFAVSLAAISKHVKILEDARLLMKERDGRTVRCRIDLRPLDEAGRTIRELNAFWNARMDELESYLRSGSGPLHEERDDEQ